MSASRVWAVAPWVGAVVLSVAVVGRGSWWMRRWWVSKKASEQRNGFLQAACDGDIVRIVRGIEAGQDLSCSDKNGSNALMLAAWAGRKDIVQILLHCGADIHSVSLHGWTALTYAARAGESSTLEVLLEWGAKVNIVENTTGATPLMFAAFVGSLECVDLLLEYGADPLIRTKQGALAFAFAEENGHDGIAGMLRHRAADAQAESQAMKEQKEALAARLKAKQAMEIRKRQEQAYIQHVEEQRRRAAIERTNYLSSFSGQVEVLSVGCYVTLDRPTVREIVRILMQNKWDHIHRLKSKRPRAPSFATMFSEFEALHRDLLRRRALNALTRPMVRLEDRQESDSEEEVSEYDESENDDDEEEDEDDDDDDNDDEEEEQQDGGKGIRRALSKDSNMTKSVASSIGSSSSGHAQYEAPPPVRLFDILQLLQPVLDDFNSDHPAQPELGRLRAAANAVSFGTKDVDHSIEALERESDDINLVHSLKVLNGLGEMASSYLNGLRLSAGDSSNARTRMPYFLQVEPHIFAPLARLLVTLASIGSSSELHQVFTDATKSALQSALSVVQAHLASVSLLRLETTRSKDALAILGDALLYVTFVFGEEKYLPGGDPCTGGAGLAAPATNHSIPLPSPRSRGVSTISPITRQPSSGDLIVSKTRSNTEFIAPANLGTSDDHPSLPKLSPTHAATVATPVPTSIPSSSELSSNDEADSTNPGYIASKILAEHLRTLARSTQAQLRFLAKLWKRTRSKTKAALRREIAQALVGERAISYLVCPAADSPRPSQDVPSSKRRLARVLGISDVIVLATSSHRNIRPGTGDFRLQSAQGKKGLSRNLSALPSLARNMSIIEDSDSAQPMKRARLSSLSRRDSVQNRVRVRSVLGEPNAGRTTSTMLQKRSQALRTIQRAARSFMQNTRTTGHEDENVEDNLDSIVGNSTRLARLPSKPELIREKRAVFLEEIEALLSAENSSLVQGRVPAKILDWLQDDRPISTSICFPSSATATLLASSPLAGSGPATQSSDPSPPLEPEEEQIASLVPPDLSFSAASSISHVDEDQVDLLQMLQQAVIDSDDVPSAVVLRCMQDDLISRLLIIFQRRKLIQSSVGATPASPQQKRVETLLLQHCQTLLSICCDRTFRTSDQRTKYARRRRGEESSRCLIEDITCELMERLNLLWEWNMGADHLIPTLLDILQSSKTPLYLKMCATKLLSSFAKGKVKVFDSPSAINEPIETLLFGPLFAQPADTELSDEETMEVFLQDLARSPAQPVHHSKAQALHAYVSGRPQLRFLTSQTRGKPSILEDVVRITASALLKHTHTTELAYRVAHQFDLAGVVGAAPGTAGPVAIEPADLALLVSIWKASWEIASALIGVYRNSQQRVCAVENCSLPVVEDNDSWRCEQGHISETHDVKEGQSYQEICAEVAARARVLLNLGVAVRKEEDMAKKSLNYFKRVLAHAKRFIGSAAADNIKADKLELYLKTKARYSMLREQGLRVLRDTLNALLRLRSTQMEENPDHQSSRAALIHAAASRGSEFLQIGTLRVHGSFERDERIPTVSEIPLDHVLDSIREAFLTMQRHKQDPGHHALDFQVPSNAAMSIQSISHDILDLLLRVVEDSLLGSEDSVAALSVMQIISVKTPDHKRMAKMRLIPRLVELVSQATRKSEENVHGAMWSILSRIALQVMCSSWLEAKDDSPSGTIHATALDNDGSDDEDNWTDSRALLESFTDLQKSVALHMYEQLQIHAEDLKDPKGANYDVAELQCYRFLSLLGAVCGRKRVNLLFSSLLSSRSLLRSKSSLSFGSASDMEATEEDQTQHRRDHSNLLLQLVISSSPRVQQLALRIGRRLFADADAEMLTPILFRVAGEWALASKGFTSSGKVSDLAMECAGMLRYLAGKHPQSWRRAIIRQSSLATSEYLEQPFDASPNVIFRFWTTLAILNMSAPSTLRHGCRIKIVPDSGMSGWKESRATEEYGIVLRMGKRLVAGTRADALQHTMAGGDTSNGFMVVLDSEPTKLPTKCDADKVLPVTIMLEAYKDFFMSLRESTWLVDVIGFFTEQFWNTSFQRDVVWCEFKTMAMSVLHAWLSTDSSHAISQIASNRPQIWRQIVAICACPAPVSSLENVDDLSSTTQAMSDIKIVLCELGVSPLDTAMQRIRLAARRLHRAGSKAGQSFDLGRRRTESGLSVNEPPPESPTQKGKSGRMSVTISDSFSDTPVDVNASPSRRQESMQTVNEDSNLDFDKNSVVGFVGDKEEGAESARRESELDYSAVVDNDLGADLGSDEEGYEEEEDDDRAATEQKSLLSVPLLQPGRRAALARQASHQMFSQESNAEPRSLPSPRRNSTATSTTAATRVEQDSGGTDELSPALRRMSSVDPELSVRRTSIGPTLRHNSISGGARLERRHHSISSSLPPPPAPPMSPTGQEVRRERRRVKFETPSRHDIVLATPFREMDRSDQSSYSFELQVERNRRRARLERKRRAARRLRTLSSSSSVISAAESHEHERKRGDENGIQMPSLCQPDTPRGRDAAALTIPVELPTVDTMLSIPMSSTGGPPTPRSESQRANAKRNFRSTGPRRAVVQVGTLLRISNDEIGVVHQVNLALNGNEVALVDIFNTSTGLMTTTWRDIADLELSEDIIADRYQLLTIEGQAAPESPKHLKATMDSKGKERLAKELRHLCSRSAILHARRAAVAAISGSVGAEESASKMQLLVGEAGGASQILGMLKLCEATSSSESGNEAFGLKDNMHGSSPASSTSSTSSRSPSSSSAPLPSAASPTKGLWRAVALLFQRNDEFADMLLDEAILYLSMAAKDTLCFETPHPLFPMEDFEQEAEEPFEGEEEDGEESVSYQGSVEELSQSSRTQEMVSIGTPSSNRAEGSLSPLPRSFASYEDQRSVAFSDGRPDCPSPGTPSSVGSRGTFDFKPRKLSGSHRFYIKGASGLLVEFDRRSSVVSSATQVTLSYDPQDREVIKVIGEGGADAWQPVVVSGDTCYIHWNVNQSDIVTAMERMDELNIDMEEVAWGVAVRVRSLDDVSNADEMQVLEKPFGWRLLQVIAENPGRVLARGKGGVYFLETAISYLRANNLAFKSELCEVVTLLVKAKMALGRKSELAQWNDVMRHGLYKLHYDLLLMFDSIAEDGFNSVSPYFVCLLELLVICRGLWALQPEECFRWGKDAIASILKDPYAKLKAPLCSLVVYGRRENSKVVLDCETCQLVGSDAVCAACAATCHVGHELSNERTTSLPCGCSLRGPDACGALRPFADVWRVGVSDRTWFDLVCQTADVIDCICTGTRSIPRPFIREAYRTCEDGKILRLCLRSLEECLRSEVQDVWWDRESRHMWANMLDQGMDSVAEIAFGLKVLVSSLLPSAFLFWWEERKEEWSERIRTNQAWALAQAMLQLSFALAPSATYAEWDSRLQNWTTTLEGISGLVGEDSCSFLLTGEFPRPQVYMKCNTCELEICERCSAKHTSKGHDVSEETFGPGFCDERTPLPQALQKPRYELFSRMSEPNFNMLHDLYWMNHESEDVPDDQVPTEPRTLAALLNVPYNAFEGLEKDLDPACSLLPCTSTASSSVLSACFLGILIEILGVKEDSNFLCVSCDADHGVSLAVGALLSSSCRSYGSGTVHGVAGSKNAAKRVMHNMDVLRTSFGVPLCPAQAYFGDLIAHSRAVTDFGKKTKKYLRSPTDPPPPKQAIPGLLNQYDRIFVCGVCSVEQLDALSAMLPLDGALLCPMVESLEYGIYVQRNQFTGECENRTLAPIYEDSDAFLDEIQRLKRIFTHDEPGPLPRKAFFDPTPRLSGHENGENGTAVQNEARSEKDGEVSSEPQDQLVAATLGETPKPQSYMVNAPQEMEDETYRRIRERHEALRRQNRQREALFEHVGKVWDLESWRSLSDFATKRPGRETNYLGFRDITTRSIEAYPLIQQVKDLEIVKGRFAVLRRVNDSLSEVLPLVNLTPRYLTGGVGRQLSRPEMKRLIFLSTKLDAWSKALEPTWSDAPASSMPSITVSRKLADVGLVEDSLFMQTYNQIQNFPLCSLRRRDQAFKVRFAGEGGHDVGGLYRDLFTEMCSEIRDGRPPLFFHPPLMSKGRGEPLLPRPSLTSPGNLRLFEFFGNLVAVACMRHGVTLSIDVSPLVWKVLVKDLLTTQDLVYIDEVSLQEISFIRKASEDEFRSVFPDAVFAVAPIDANYKEPSQEDSTRETAEDSEESTEEHVTASSTPAIKASGNLVELCPLGKERRVTFDNALEYSQLLEVFRQTECQTQISAIRRGIAPLVPLRLFPMFTWQELENIVCGVADVDVEFLHSRTKYVGGVKITDPHIRYFWDVLANEFTPEDRTQFLRFVWGRERLSTAEEGNTFVIGPHLRARDSGDPDKWLPVAHTCFFSIDLPAFSNREILKERLLFAIRNCSVIDADQTAESTTNMALSL